MSSLWRGHTTSASRMCQAHICGKTIFGKVHEKRLCAASARTTHTPLSCMNCKIIIMPLIIIVATGANMLPTDWRLNTMWINMDRKMSWTIYLHVCRIDRLFRVPPPVGSAVLALHTKQFRTRNMVKLRCTGCTACATTQIIWWCPLCDGSFRYWFCIIYRFPFYFSLSRYDFIAIRWE